MELIKHVFQQRSLNLFFRERIPYPVKVDFNKDDQIQETPAYSQCSNI